MAPEQRDAYEKQVSAMYTQMVRVQITPLWAKLLDFQTGFPTALEKLVGQSTQ